MSTDVDSEERNISPDKVETSETIEDDISQTVEQSMNEKEVEEMLASDEEARTIVVKLEERDSSDKEEEEEIIANHDDEGEILCTTTSEKVCVGCQ